MLAPVHVMDVIGAADPVSSAVIFTVWGDEYQTFCSGPLLYAQPPLSITDEIPHVPGPGGVEFLPGWVGHAPSLTSTYSVDTVPAVVPSAPFRPARVSLSQTILFWPSIQP